MTVQDVDSSLVLGADGARPANVGAINGRVLTALSLAGVCGPVAVNYLRQAQISRGISVGQAYDVTLFIMAALLVVGFFCNLAIKPVYRPGPAPVESKP